MEDLKKRTHFSCVKTEADARLPVPLHISAITMDIPQIRASLEFSVGSDYITASYVGLPSSLNNKTCYWALDGGSKRETTVGWNSGWNSYIASTRFSGLSPSTRYRVKAHVTTSYNQESYATTSAAPIVYPSTPTFRLENRTHSGLYIEVYSKNAKYIKVTRSGDGTVQQISGSSGYVNFQNLSPNTTYTITARGYVNDWTYGGQGSQDFTTLSKLAITDYAISNISGSSADVSITAPGATSYDYLLYNYANQAIAEYLNQSKNRITVTGLTSGYEYYFKLRAKNSSQVSDYKTTHRFTTRAGVDPWSWSEKAKVAFGFYGGDKRGPTTELTVEEWNRFVRKVIEYSNWYSPSLEANDSIKDCEMYIPGNDKLMAWIFNRVKNRILKLKTNSWNMSDVSPGHKVMGSYFTNMSTALNSCTKTLTQEIEEFENEDILMVYERLFEEIENTIIPE